MVTYIQKANAIKYSTISHLVAVVLLIFPNISLCQTANIRSTSHTYNKNGYMKIYRPRSSKVGDLLFLFLSRTDDVLPVVLPGEWKLGASCLKPHNMVQKCLRIEEGDCEDKLYADFCYGGADLGTVVFYKKVARDEPSSYSYNLFGFYGHPAWAILASVRAADINTDNPIRSVAMVSCDMSNKSHFPSVYGKVNDLLLLSMAFDDYVSEDKFLAPKGTQLEAYVNGSDEAGFLYSEKINSEGQTGIKVTNGPGKSPGKCKDALISLVVRRRISNVPSHVLSDVPSYKLSSDAPSLHPSSLLSKVPSVFPSSKPSTMPSAVPSNMPTSIPNVEPSSFPSAIPSSIPSIIPSSYPSTMPSDIPSMMPSSIPSLEPSSFPSSIPSHIPSIVPSSYPSTMPSDIPSMMPSSIPSLEPSSFPSSIPSHIPSIVPSSYPSTMPSDIPSMMPSSIPSLEPSSFSSTSPSSVPSNISSNVPSDPPSSYPSTMLSYRPSMMPSSIPSLEPSSFPSFIPSHIPSIVPSSYPSTMPSDRPSMMPSSIPSLEPSSFSSTSPSSVPSNISSNVPSDPPSSYPSTMLSYRPSMMPSSIPILTITPTHEKLKPQTPNTILLTNATLTPSHNTPNTSLLLIPNNVTTNDATPPFTVLWLLHNSTI